MTKFTFEKILRISFGRYIIVGGSVYALELATLLALKHLTGNSAFAITVSFIVGLVISFVLQKVVAFQDRQTSRAVVLPQIFAVSALIFVNYLFTLFAVTLLEDYMPLIISRTLALVCTTLWNFYFYKFHIFKSPVID